MAKSRFFRQLRIGILLLLLAAIVIDMGLERFRTHNWEGRERIALYPIAADPRLATRRYVDKLDDGSFEAIEAFFASEAGRYGLTNPQPIDLQLRAPVTELPPSPPAERNVIANALWSLRLRYWAYKVKRDDPAPDTRISMFLVYHDPASNPELPHSLGLRRLLVGVAHLFASRRQEAANSIVIAHELMHTLGASDKYDPATNMPLHPDGYAEPERKPLLPQRAAEIMGGRIPISPTRAEMPPNLRATVVGTKTAQEIAWIE